MNSPTPLDADRFIDFSQLDEEFVGASSGRKVRNRGEIDSSFQPLSIEVLRKGSFIPFDSRSDSNTFAFEAGRFKNVSIQGVVIRFQID